MYKIEITNKFKQSLKKLKKRNINLKPLENVIDLLANGETLPPKYKNHQLQGELKGYYDCHILNDLVLIYKIEDKKLILLLFDIGTHSDLF